MTIAEPMKSRWKRGALAWLGLFLVILAAYWPAVRGGFLWDDAGHVTKASLQSLHGLWRIWFERNATQQYYPVLHSAFWVEHRLWGEATLGYHLTNLALHATAAWLFAILLWRLTRERLGERARPYALFAGLLFALHPVGVETAAWISEEKNTLSTVFYLLAVLAYLRFDRDRTGSGYFLALVLFVLALLSKSVTATLPAALLVILWWQRGRLSGRRDVVPLLPWFALAAAMGLLTAWVERHDVGAQGTAYDLGFLQRGLLAARAIGFYLGKLFWPANLIFIYPRWRIDPHAVSAYLYLLGVAGLTAALWLLRKRTRAPLAAWLFFVGSLFPALGFFNIYPFVYSYVADHFQYLASLGIFAAAAGFAASLNLGRARLAVGGGIILLLLGTLTWRQAQTYRDVETLYRVTLEKNPACWMAHYNLGVLDVGEGRMEEGLAHYRSALAIKPDLDVLHSDFGTALVRAGRIPEAIGQFREAVSLNPGYAVGHLNLGAALNQAGRPAEAIAECEEALRLQPNYSEANFNLALALQATGRPLEAIAQFEGGLRLDPADVVAREDLGILLAQAGRLPEAVQQFKEALRLRPGDRQALDALAQLRAMMAP